MILVAGMLNTIRLGSSLQAAIVYAYTGRSAP
jgi:hypothetical protein